MRRTAATRSFLTVRACGLAELEAMLMAGGRQVQLASGQPRLRDRLLAEYSLAIRGAVGRNWLRLTGAAQHLARVVRVCQAPNGDVVTVQIIESSDNRAFDSSVEQAVWKASPLLLLKDVGLFRRDLQFVFDPQG